MSKAEEAIRQFLRELDKIPDGPTGKPKVAVEPKTEPGRALVVRQEVLPPVSDWDQALAIMNEHHAVIESVGGKTVIASWEPSGLDQSRLMVVFQNKGDF